MVYVNPYLQTELKIIKKKLYHIKPKKQLSFQTRFSKSWPTHKKQVVNSRQQTPQGQTAAKSWTLRYIIQLLPILKRQLGHTKQPYTRVDDKEYTDQSHVPTAI